MSLHIKKYGKNHTQSILFTTKNTKFKRLFRISNRFHSILYIVFYCNKKIQHHVKKSLFAILKRHNKKTLFFYKAIDRSRVQKLGRFPAQ